MMSAMMKSNQGGDAHQLISAPLFDGDDMDFRLLSDYLFEDAQQTSKEGGGAVSRKSGGGDAKAKKQKKGSLARSVSVESSTFPSYDYSFYCTSSSRILTNSPPPPTISARLYGR